ncbi:Nif11 domain/cupin domain-containing protein [Cyanobium sp. CH-040]|uniref:Nif11 domain/cupin domain-containing protein n=1 Tax=Cyanobium sp. CH-040 TaxID=2823708 RepID=UPI0020CC7737|nr:Nif11 domain/cupin domain-containing protein [Cyanobium sp. CH-040]MCP9928898.1 Nif11 domain/cupin domain-containing protein [Cyanobium sp. CH-040]
MAEAQLQQFLEKVRQLNAFVALSESDPAVREALAACSHHHAVVALARRHGFEIGRRWGEGDAAALSDGNLFAGPCPPAGEERVSVLARGETWRLERIHSCQASSPPGFWYDQSEHEWVTLLQGSARIRLAPDATQGVGAGAGGTKAVGGEVLELCRGDTLLIPAHRRHRLEATDGEPGSVWLALFWTGACAG